MRKVPRLPALTTSLQRWLESCSQGNKAKREIKSVMIGKKNKTVYSQTYDVENFNKAADKKLIKQLKNFKYLIFISI